MIRTNIVVEGQTEETFVRDVLAPFLAEASVFACARSVETSRRGAVRFRGGLINFEKARRDIDAWLKQDRESVVTTMFDLYRLPPEFPGQSEAAELSGVERATFLEAALRGHFNTPRFVPYLQVHEFEALVFSGPEEAHHVTQSNAVKAMIDQSLRECGGPELVNLRPERAPSKRLLSVYSQYEKTIHGPQIVAQIGVRRLMANCPHFASWVTSLTSIS